MALVRTLVPACVAVLAAGCVGVEQVQRTGGVTEQVISCGYLNWIYCYERARERCPEGYRVLSQSEGYGPKEMRVACQASEK